MDYYILLITLYHRYYLHIEGYKEMETESSKRRKYTWSLKIFNSGVRSLLFRTKQRFLSNTFQNWALTDDKQILRKPKIFLSSITSSCWVKNLWDGKWALHQKWGETSNDLKEEECSPVEDILWRIPLLAGPEVVIGLLSWTPQVIQAYRQRL